MDILIADDSTASLKLLAGILNKMNFKVITAEDGQQAWEKLNLPNPPRIALIDWMMPRLSGIDLVKKIREKEKNSGQYTYIIMITSNNTEEDANIGFEAGVDNFLTKPIDPETLSITLRIARRIIAMQQQISTQYKKQQEDILRAKEIQQILNTNEIPKIDNTNIRAVYNPSQEMGGDFFNIIKTVRGNLAIIMVDCTGHGLEASMYATLLKSVCDRHIYLLDNPKFLANFVQMVNIDIAAYIASDQFPVMFVSVYDPVTMKFYYSSANGEHPYLIRNKSVHHLQRAPGMHLGYNTESQYVVKSFKVENEDILLFYSDAIIEIEGAEWSREDDRILKLELSKMGNNLAKDNMDFMKFIQSTSQSNGLNDDLSLIYLQIKEPENLFYEITSESEIEGLINNVKDSMFNYDYNWDESEKVTIAIREIVVNAIKHGNKLDPNKKVKITSLINCKYTQFVIEDEGDGFCEELLSDPTDYNRLKELIDSGQVEAYTHGRGIWMAKRLMDKVEFEENGRVTTLQKTKDSIYTYNNYKTPIDNM